MISLKRWISFRIAVLLAILALSVPVYAQNQVAVSYNDGTANYGVALGYGIGQGVIFTAPEDNWTLSKVTLCGKLNSSGTGLYVLEVWDLTGPLTLLALISATTSPGR
jgi:hypothetical protein